MANRKSIVRELSKITKVRPQACEDIFLGGLYHGDRTSPLSQLSTCSSHLMSLLAKICSRHSSASHLNSKFCKVSILHSYHGFVMIPKRPVCPPPPFLKPKNFVCDYICTGRLRCLENHNHLEL